MKPKRLTDEDKMSSLYCSSICLEGEWPRFAGSVATGLYSIVLESEACIDGVPRPGFDDVKVAAVRKSGGTTHLVHGGLRTE